LKLSAQICERLAELAGKGLDKRWVIMKSSAFVGVFAMFVRRERLFFGLRFKQRIGIMRPTD
jgi:hypothetical protein